MQWMVFLCAFHPAFKTDLFNNGDRVEFFLSLRSLPDTHHTEEVDLNRQVSTAMASGDKKIHKQAICKF